ncbi:MAG TPA: transketolase C-terminal domain-containing protein [Bacteroidota bacterium]|nr:transketolase C-terminal domain-containing protein [Bacteroidota bacterium]
MTQVSYEEMLIDLMNRDDRIVVLTAENRAAIRSLPRRVTDRFIDVGIAEQTMIGMAAGLALRGRIPVVHALATFLTMRAFEFIRTDIGIRRLPVKLVGAVPGFLSEANGPTHQALEDVALMRGIPGMRVFCPADIEDLVAALPAIVHDSHPWYVRYPLADQSRNHEPFVAGRGEVYGHGTDVAILTYGLLVREALDAARILSDQGHGVRVVHMRTVKPLDFELVLSCAESCRMIVTVEDHFRTGGLATAVSELLAETQARASLVTIAFRERWFKPGRLSEVLAHEGFDARGIARTISAELKCEEGSRVLQHLNPRTVVSIV